MTAARLDGHSLPLIAGHFERDHTTLLHATLHATRRVVKTPPLRGLPNEPARAGISGLDVDEQMPACVHRSAGLREQQLAVPLARHRPQLRVAR